MPRGVLLGACGAYFVDATAIVLPVFLLPRLHQSLWSELSEEERRMTDALASSLFFVGNTLGLVSLGAVGDKYGRRQPLLLGVALTVITTAASLCTPPSVGIFLASRAIAGFGAGGALNSGFLLAVEWAPPAYRLACKTCTATLGWVPGLLFLSAVAHLTREATWQALAYCLLPAPFVWLFIYFRCVKFHCSRSGAAFWQQA